MALTRLAIQGFRNLKDLSLEFNACSNLIVGDNGSGKTSILEALYFLSHGRSFRTSTYSKTISYDERQFTVHVKRDASQQPHVGQKIGLSKSLDGVTNIRIDGNPESKMSELAKHLAVQLITPDSVSFFLGGPKERRQFCDLGLFHVKQSYQEAWTRFSRVLKHRNALLKKSQNYLGKESEYWDEEFVRLAVEIDGFRREYIEQLNSRLRNLQKDYQLFTTEVELKYSQGWRKDNDLKNELVKNYERDLKQGFTSVGPHKADLKFRVPASVNETLRVNVADSFSRGQIKLLLYAVKVCQNQIISEYGKTPILLVDDISSEIDEVNLGKILQLLNASRAQLVITAINDKCLTAMKPILKDIKLFHVKHGKLQ